MSSGPTSLLKLGHQEHLAQDCVQTGLLHFHSEGDSTPRGQVELPVHWFVPVVGFFLDTTEQSLDPSPTLSPQILTLTRSSSQLLLLKAEKSHLPQPFVVREMLLFLHHLCIPLLDSLQELLVYFVLKSPELDMEFQICLTRAE